MTFDELTEIEPKLNDLRDQALRIATGTTYWEFERNDIWHEQFKTRFQGLVGFEAEDSRINRPEHWDTAYKAFCEAMRI